jgi:long-chain acyl-CoA synthetase
VTLLDYKYVCEEGSKMVVEFDPVEASSVYTLSYTSGTTGMPKGVMLMHKNFITNIACMEKFDGVFKPQDDDVYMSYLPLAHVFERFMMTMCVAYRIQYGLYQGDVMKLKDDLVALRPTFMVSVPRLFTRFYD